MKKCKCEHWQTCPVCYPQGFDEAGNRKPVEIPQTRGEMLARIKELKAERDELAAQVEKMREFLQFLWCDAPLNGYTFARLEEMIALPDLSTSILNRMRAETAERCAEVCDVHATGWKASPGCNPMAGFIASSNCATDIRALAADMEAK